MKPKNIEEKCRELSRVCAGECVSCALHCSRMEGMEECISACNTCEQLCMKVVSASVLTEELLRKCEDACLECASACSGHDDMQCLACAESCRRNADECSRMIIYGTFDSH